jgi:hypothetical protein
MSQHQTAPVGQQQSKAPVPSPAPSVPIPLDPNLLRHISGGETTDAPRGGW